MLPNRLIIQHAIVTMTMLVSSMNVASAQSANSPGAAPSVLSPEVHHDHRVTFRLVDPEAKVVKLVGINREAVDLKQDQQGIWTVTVGPIDPGLYEYSFKVDGEDRLDPANPHVKPDRDLDSSLVDVRSDQPLFYQWRDVPQGIVRLHDYFSRPLRRLRAMRVYTPPNYDRLVEQRFPVLYLLHGTGDTEATWSEFGRAHRIMDNLIADKKALPMIVVMPDGHADLREEEGIHPANFLKFEQDLMDSIIPFIGKNYRTIQDPSGRAICGLSMGGMQSLYLGMNHPEIFAWVGGMSGYVPDAEKMCARAFNNDKLNDQLRLLWHSIGKDDFLFKEYFKFDALLEKRGIKREFHVTEGAHEWTVWRQYLAEFAPLLFR